MCFFGADVSESPLCEISLACDNLLCDSHGRAPNAKLVVHVRNSPNSGWLKYAATEVVEVLPRDGLLLLSTSIVQD